MRPRASAGRGGRGGIDRRCRQRHQRVLRALFARLDAELPPLEVVLYNPSDRARCLRRLSPDDVRRLPRGAARRRGALLFTGASASVKGCAQSAPFAMGQFALRGLAQSLARELAPRGIHVARSS